MLTSIPNALSSGTAIGRTVGAYRLRKPRWVDRRGKDPAAWRMATAGGPRASVRRGLAGMRFAFRTPQDRLPKELARAPQLLCPPHLDLQKADHAPDSSRATRTGHFVCYLH
jgi:hypothetical protein